MPIKIACPKCRKGLTVPDQLAGRSGKCPACGAQVSVPNAPSAEPLAFAVAPVAVAVAPERTAPTTPRPTHPPSASRRRGRLLVIFSGLTVLGLAVGGYFLWSSRTLSTANAQAVVPPPVTQASAGISTPASSSVPVAKPTAKLPFELSDFRRVLGPPGEARPDSLLYSGTMKVSAVGQEITVAFNANTMEGLFFAGGLFKEHIFRYPEGDEIMDRIDDIGHEGKSKRFRYRIEVAKVPTGWRQVRFMPLD